MKLYSILFLDLKIENTTLNINIEKITASETSIGICILKIRRVNLIPVNVKISATPCFM